VDWARKTRCGREQAAALIIVLAFVVLTTGLVVAYFSRATSDRPVAHSSFNQSKVDQLAQSAMDNVIGDLRQEILNGSGSPSPTASPVTLFVPTSSANMVPMRKPTPTPGTTPAIPNLIRRSASTDPALWPDPVVGPARGSRASAVNSTTDVSANGRSVTRARWNSHYLIRRANASLNDSYEGEPIADFTSPDWVLVTGVGATPAPTPSDVIGRYAYAVYDEGGLLDLNAAGYPTPAPILQYGRKGSLAFADLTALPISVQDKIDNIVGWRNYASARPGGTFPNLSFNTTSATTYYNFILSDPNLIKLTAYSPIFFLRTAWQAPQNNNQTDQAFITRQQLIEFGRKTELTSNALQYLGTLSREALASVPQWSPATPDSINPNFQALLVTASFTRNDGTTAYVGDYLVNQRFLLQRLNWLTYKGPSAGRSIPNPPPLPAVGSADYDMYLLTRTNGITFGLTRDFLLQGTAENILKYFGLVWDVTNERWNYTSPSGGPLASSIATLGTLTGTREPDFFELLRAGIIDGSLGDVPSYSDPAMPVTHQQSKMLHILTIGANLIAQTRADSYPVRIACTVDGTTMEAVGKPRLPYVSGLAACPVAGTGAAGGVNWLLVPNLWDPFRDTWDLTEANAGNTGNGPNLTPGYLRPPVRITVTGSVGFGAAAASQSGSVDPASVTAFSRQLTIDPALSLTLATGNSTFGRDGLLEASRLGTSDFSAAPASYTTTTSPLSAGYAWNQVTRPPRPDGTVPGTTNFVVFRFSIPGSDIPTTGQNPVLILQPGFQMSLEYQSPNGQWYPYSFLQGNNAISTWIASNLDLAATFSQYAQPTGFTAPTIVNSGTTTPTLWTVLALAQAAMSAKADPRSIRYNSQIGVVNLASPPMSVVSAGIIGSIWPNTYATPPPMTASAFPAPTPTPNANPATYSQLGDNGPAASNPYSEATPSSNAGGDAVRPVMMNRPFRSAGEMGYAFRDQPFRTLSFSSANSPDAGLLDLFTTVAYGATPTPSPSPSITPTYPTPTATPRGGVISLNSLQAPALAAVIARTIRREDTPRVFTGGAPSPSPSPLTATPANNVATSLVLSTSSAPILNRAGLANLIAGETGLGPTVPKTQRESIARALGEVVQTRTWNLMLDLITQSGRYPPGETDLRKFVVEGEQRYWVHVAIDRFTGEVLDKQIEVVNE
jgi:hypothetical protein